MKEKPIKIDETNEPLNRRISESRLSWKCAYVKSISEGFLGRDPSTVVGVVMIAPDSEARARAGAGAIKAMNRNRGIRSQCSSLVDGMRMGGKSDSTR